MTCKGTKAEGQVPRLFEETGKQDREKIPSDESVAMILAEEIGDPIARDY